MSSKNEHSSLTLQVSFDPDEDNTQRVGFACTTVFLSQVYRRFVACHTLSLVAVGFFVNTVSRQATAVMMLLAVMVARLASRPLSWTQAPQEGKEVHTVKGPSRSHLPLMGRSFSVSYKNYELL